MANPTSRDLRTPQALGALAALALGLTALPVAAQPPATITCATDTSTLVAAVTGNSGNGGNPNTLRFVNGATGQTTFVTTTSVVPNHLAYNPDLQIFYYINHSGQSLYGYSLNTGVHTLIDGDIRTLPGPGDPPGGFTGHDAGAFWNGRFYYIPHNGNTGQTGNTLYWIEFGANGLTTSTSGTLPLTLPGGFSHMGDFGDIAITPAGIMYGSSTAQSGNQINGFFRVDLTQPTQATRVVTILNNTYAGAQLALSGNGSLYGNVWQTNQLDLLNPATGLPISSVAIQPGGDFFDMARVSRPLCDFGDLPSGPYATLLAGNGPSHKTSVLPNVRLGVLVDSEPDGQPNADGTGDGADEDGVRFLSPLVAGRPADIQVASSGAGRLNAWIDFNSDGAFAASERIATDVLVAAGNNLLNNVPVPATATGPMAARFRLTIGLNQGGGSPTGTALNGEVEDYMLGCIGDQVWNDLNGDGINDPDGADNAPGGGDDEIGIANVVVRLVRPVSPYTPIPDGNNVGISTTTNAGGFYQFCGLPPAASSGLTNPGTYRVLFEPAVAFNDFSPANVGANDLIDSDADPDTLGAGTEGLAPLPTLAPITIAAAQIDNSVDAGLRAVTVALVTSARAYEDAGSVVFEFSTGYEARSGAFEVLRWDPERGDYAPVTAHPVSALHASPQGGVYRVVDEGAIPDGRLTYVIVEHQTDGRVRAYGPYTVAVRGQRGDAPAIDGQAAEPHVSSRLARRMAAGARESAAAQRVAKAVPRRPSAFGLGKGSAGGALQVDVRESGLHFVSSSEIAGAVGLSNGQVRQLLERGRVAVENLGRPVDWLPASRSGDGLFFYGEAIDDLYTLDNPYRVRLDETGDRMELVKGTLPLASESGSFRSTEHFELDKVPVIAATNDPSGGFWYWSGLNAAGADRVRSFEVAGVHDAVGGQATLTVHLVGVSNGLAALDHHATIRVNGVAVGDTAWAAETRHAASFDFDASLLAATNTLEVEGYLADGSTASLFYIDAFDLEYDRAYRAVADRLEVRGDGNPVVTVGGFTSPDLVVLDLTDPRQPRVMHATRVDLAADGFRASFVPGSPSTPYLVTTATAARSGLSLRAVAPQIDLRSTQHAYEHVVIAPAAWRQAAERLAAYRSAAGMSSLAVDLEDVYDAFADGLRTPWAIRDFLAYARQNWVQGPTHVVLAGRGTFDARDLMGAGDCFVPAAIVGSPYGLITSDGVLADLEHGDSIPEVAIGRLPIVSAGELHAYIDKLEAYGGSSGDWRGRAVLLADNPDVAGDYPVQSGQVGAIWAGDYGLQEIYLSQLTPAAARAALVAAWNEGAQLVNYVGHGGVTMLAAEGLLKASDMGALANGDRLPIVSALTCVVGRSDIPALESLAEALVTDPDGGAIAVFASSGLSLSGAAHQLDLLYAAALTSAQPGASLGSIVVDALSAFGAGGAPREMLDAYGITGDPAVGVP